MLDPLDVLRREHGEALKRSEMRYAALTEIAPVGIFRADPAGHICYVNSAWRRIAGIAAETAAADGWMRAIHPGDLAAVEQRWHAAIEGAEPFCCDFRFLHDSGRVTWVMGQARSEKNEAGEVIGYVGTLTDITDRKEAEETLKRADAEVRRAGDELSFYKYAVDQAAIVAVTDQAGGITYINDKFCEISGYRREELLGRNHRIVNSGLHPPQFFKDMYSTIARGRVWKGEIRNRSSEGRHYWVDLTVIPFRDAHSRVTRYVAIGADITKRKQSEAALDGQRQALEVANGELGAKNTQLSELYQTAQRFVDDVSHEFRTPLSVIKGYSELMREGIGGKLSEEQLGFAQLILDRARDMTQMVDDLLDTSKLRAGLLRVDREPCDVAALFAAMHPIVDGRAAGNKIQWVEQIEPGLPQVFADQEKAQRILVNLAINAIKFSPEASRITLTAKAGDAGDVMISVTDEGPGISPENLKAIFERFRQVGNVPSSTKGFGLGLNIARELVALNLGTMNVSSELQKGSTFGFTLPANDPAVIVARLFDYLDRLRVPPGKFAILRVTPERSAENSTALRGFLACSAHPGDVILTAGEDGALILFGYTSDPEGWLQRLTTAASNIQQFGPNKKLCAFEIQLVAAVEYPTSRADVLHMLQEQLNGVPIHA